MACDNFLHRLQYLNFAGNENPPDKNSPTSDKSSEALKDVLHSKYLIFKSVSSS
jgi:hypothetical protein